MRKVVDSEEVAHLWANQVQPTAYNPGRTFYFDSSIIYSYGAHFPIAMLITYRDARFCLFTQREYSTTTARHKSYARRAIPDDVQVIPVTECPSYRFRSTSELKTWARAEYRKRIKRAESMFPPVKRPKGMRRSTLYNSLKCALSEYTQANALSFIFRLGFKEIDTQAILARYQSEIAPVIEAERARTRAAEQREAEREAIYAKEAAEREAIYAEKLDQWRAGGEPTNLPRHSLPVALRIKGDLCQTSHGATVPASMLPALYKRYRKAREARSLDGVNNSFGLYSARAITDSHLIVGCHKIPFSEIERIAGILGIADPLPNPFPQEFTSEPTEQA